MTVENAVTSDLHTEALGRGDTVVLVHGSLTTGVEEWSAQRPLADQGFRLVLVDRRGYGASPEADGEDFLRDGEDIAGLLAHGGHLVAHSYGCLGAMIAAAEVPASVRSLTLLEPVPFTLVPDDVVAKLIAAVQAVWDVDLPDDEWLVRFLEAVGTDPGVIPPEALDEVVAMVPILRRGRPPWDRGLPFDELASAVFPKLVVSGGHSAGFESICDELAHRIGASRSVVAGAGHEIQFTGAPLNELLFEMWTSQTQR